ncbi:MAG TPA: Flp pilus assembly protein CpaB [Gaiellales bacterium]
MQRIMQSRGGTVLVGGVVAAVAVALLLVYLAQYRDSLNNDNESVPVLVANQQISQGTSGDTVASQHMFKQMEVRRGDLQDGAITDPSQIAGRVASATVYPGTQLTTTEFTTAPSDAAAVKVKDDMRAIAIPLDAATGAIGYVHAGDHVDILGGFNVIPLDSNGVPKQGAQQRPVLKIIAQDVPVLFVPPGVKPGDAGTVGTSDDNIVVALTDAQASNVAFASQNGKLWVTVRGADAKNSFDLNSRDNFVTLETVLFGVKPVAVERSFGGK